MAISTRIDNSIGSVAANGATGISFEANPNNRGFAPYPADSYLTVLSNSVFDAGICGIGIIASTSPTGITGTVPGALNLAGGMFSLVDQVTTSHLLTASAVDAGKKVFVSQFSGNLGSGTRVTLGSGAGVTFRSDGSSYHVLSFSGSVTINGT